MIALINEISPLKIDCIPWYSCPSRYDTPEKIKRLKDPKLSPSPMYKLLVKAIEKIRMLPKEPKTGSKN